MPDPCGPPCPTCGGATVAERVDIGVGLQRIEPWSCPACQWVEPPLDVDLIDLDDEHPFDLT